MILSIVQLNPTIGDLEGNGRKVIEAIRQAKSKGAEVVVFSELVLCGYFPDDLLLDRRLIEEMAQQLEKIAPETRGIFVAVGVARFSLPGNVKPLYNSAAVFIDGKLVGYKDKTLLPTYDVFDERRYFESVEEQPVFEYRGKRIGITICEDVWQHAGGVGYSHYLLDPVADLAAKKLDLLLNLSASPYGFQRSDTRLQLFQKVARTVKCPVIFCNQVGANDQLVFDGHSFALDREGKVIRWAKGFAEDEFLVDEKERGSAQPRDLQGIGELYQALILGVRDYFHKQGFQKAIVGLSGGIDSALVACIAKEALGAHNVLTLGMPSRFSSPGSIEDAAELAKRLGVAFQVIPIESIFRESLSLLEPFFSGKAMDVTEENLQPRIRAMVLMAFCNKQGYLLLNTGNKSEMAMGYCTLYGDMAGALGVLQDVTKLRVYELARHVGIIPASILKKVPSAELRENQSDSDTLPPYEVLDPILEDFLEQGLSAEEIAKKRKHPLEFVQGLMRKVYCAEYKRRQAPIGIRVTSKAFSKGRVVPIVQKWD